MSKPLKWLLRIVALFVSTFILMLSGLFDPLSESLKVPVTNWMNIFPSADPLPYPDRLENSYFAMYVAFNLLAATVVIIAGEWLARLARRY
jgi:hypothetical protein